MIIMIGLLASGPRRCKLPFPPGSTHLRIGSRNPRNKNTNPSCAIGCCCSLRNVAEALAPERSPSPNRPGALATRQDRPQSRKKQPAQCPGGEREREKERERERERARRRLLPAAWGAERWVGGPYCCLNKRDFDCCSMILIHFALGLTFWYILIQQGTPCMTPASVSAKLKHEFCPLTVLA